MEKKKSRTFSDVLRNNKDGILQTNKIGTNDMELKNTMGSSFDDKIDRTLPRKERVQH